MEGGGREGGREEGKEEGKESCDKGSTCRSRCTRMPHNISKMIGGINFTWYHYKDQSEYVY